MRLYLAVAEISFRRLLAYRTANLAGLGTNAFWGILRTYLFLGLYQGRPAVAGWTLDDAITYVWLAQSLIMPVHLWGWFDIANSVRSGDVVSDLSKPFDYYTFWLSRDLGRACYHGLFRMLPTLAVGWLLFGISLPAEPLRWGLFGLGLLLAIWVSFGLRLLVNLAAFWLLDHRGPAMLIFLVSNLLSGFLVPLAYWPDWLRPVVASLPFASLLQAPVDLLLGKADGGAAGLTLAGQLGWGLVLLLIGRRVLVVAERRLVIQGG